MLWEALREAKEHTRQIVTTWIDLANAYGSVRHNLIQFALNWYHVPNIIQELIFDYYENLMAKVETNNWSTGFFLFDIGLFQGCVLSTILFLCVFQLLIDALRPYEDKLGYKFKMAQAIKLLAEAYADDLALIAKCAEKNQRLCDITDEWLAWTKTMNAKPIKCVTMAMKQFDKRIKNENFEPLEPLSYSVFDPKITISGEPIRCILDSTVLPDPADENAFNRTHFKFLGRWLHYSLKEQEVKAKVRKQFESDVYKVDEQPIGGFMKLWIYQFHILAHLSWPFLVQDFDRNFTNELQVWIQPFLKRWSGVGRTVDSGVLYRSRSNFGLGMTAVSDHFERMQIVKCSILQSSHDPKVREIFNIRTDREAKLKRVWRATKLNTTVRNQVDLQLLFPSQNGRQGLGSGNFNAKPNKKERRELIAGVTKQLAEEKHTVHAHQLARQGAWLGWADSTLPFDFSWKNNIYGPGDHLLKFVLNASVNWVKTPDLMKLWGYYKSDSCKLCGKGPCTLHHIISACPVSLNSKRYTWRHDSVLSNIETVLRPYIEKFNETHKQQSIPHISQSFVPSKSGKKGSEATSKGISTRTSHKKHTRSARCSLLDGANDWQLLVDYDNARIVFPPEIYSTSERPDIIIWSKTKRVVLMIELTCPAEEGISAAVDRKKNRYDDLLRKIPSVWKPSLLTIEVGARGFVGHSMKSCLTKLGISIRLKDKLCKTLSLVSAKCSYAIYLARSTTNWNQKDTLVL